MKAAHWMVMGGVLLSTSCVTGATCPNTGAVAPVPTQAASVATALPTPTPPAAPKPAAPDDRPIGLLPIDDSHLFRNERADLRAKLVAVVAAQSPDFRWSSPADTDRAVRPVTKDGQRCAYDRSSWETRARHSDTRYATVERVFLEHDEELRVVAFEPWNADPIVAFKSPWNPKIPRLESYRQAFALLVRQPGAPTDLALIGGMARRQGSLSSGGLELCEEKGLFECGPGSKDFAGVLDRGAACFAGGPKSEEDILFEGTRCELSDHDDLSPGQAKLEACLCSVMQPVANATQNATQRREIGLRYESPEARARPRPSVGIIQVSTNLRATEKWHNEARPGESVYRLDVEGLESFEEPLSKCGAKHEQLVIADLELAPTGAVTAVRLAGPSTDKAVEACASKALALGGFECTGDGKPAQARLAVRFMETKPAAKTSPREQPKTTQHGDKRESGSANTPGKKP